MEVNLSNNMFFDENNYSNSNSLIDCSSITLDNEYNTNNSILLEHMNLCNALHYEEVVVPDNYLDQLNLNIINLIDITSSTFQQNLSNNSLLITKLSSYSTHIQNHIKCIILNSNIKNIIKEYCSFEILKFTSNNLNIDNTSSIKTNLSKIIVKDNNNYYIEILLNLRFKINSSIYIVYKSNINLIINRLYSIVTIKINKINCSYYYNYKYLNCTTYNTTQVPNIKKYINKYIHNSELINYSSDNHNCNQIKNILSKNFNINEQLINNKLKLKKSIKFKEYIYLSSDKSFDYTIRNNIIQVDAIKKTLIKFMYKKQCKFELLKKSKAFCFEKSIKSCKSYVCLLCDNSHNNYIYKIYFLEKNHKNCVIYVCKICYNNLIHSDMWVRCYVCKNYMINFSKTNRIKGGKPKNFNYKNIEILFG